MRGEYDDTKMSAVKEEKRNCFGSGPWDVARARKQESERERERERETLPLLRFRVSAVQEGGLKGVETRDGVKRETDGKKRRRRRPMGQRECMGVKRGKETNTPGRYTHRLVVHFLAELVATMRKEREG